MERRQASLGSPVAGVQDGSPVNTVRSPVAGGDEGMSPVPATPADPGFIVSPNPPPAFMGFTSTPQPQGCDSLTPTCSPVAFGLPLNTPPPAAQNPTALPTPQGQLHTPTWDTPPYGQHTGDTRTPAAQNPSALPTPQGQLHTPTWDTPPYGQHTGDTPTPAKDGKGCSNNMSMQATVGVKLHSPTWNTPPHGQHTGETPPAPKASTRKEMVPSPVEGEGGKKLATPLAASPASTVKSTAGLTPARPGQVLTAADLLTTPSPPACVADILAAADNGSVPPTIRVKLYSPTWNTPPCGQNTGGTPSKPRYNTAGQVTVNSPVEGEGSKRAATPRTAASPATMKNTAGLSPAPPASGMEAADLGLTPPPQGYKYHDLRTPVPAAADPTSVPATIRVKLHTPTWNTPPYGQHTGDTPSPAPKEKPAPLQVIVTSPVEGEGSRALRTPSNPLSAMKSSAGASPAARGTGAADLGLTPPPKGYKYHDLRSPEPTAAEDMGTPPHVGVKLHTPTWNTPPYGQHTGHSPAPLQERNMRVDLEPKVVKVYDCDANGRFGPKAKSSPMKIDGAAAMSDQSENQPPITPMEV